MNELDKLIWNHDKSGSAKTFLLTREELYEIVEAAIEVGQDGLEALENEAYDRGHEDGVDSVDEPDLECRECGMREAKVCYPCREE